SEVTYAKACADPPGGVYCTFTFFGSKVVPSGAAGIFQVQGKGIEIVTDLRMLFSAAMNACAPPVTSMAMLVPPACAYWLSTFKSAPGKPRVYVSMPFMW